MTDLPTLTERSPQPPWQDVHKAIDIFHGSSDEQERINIIQQCVQWWTPYTIEWGQNWRYSRARWFEEDTPPDNVRELIWPPSESVVEGRLNTRGQPIMYLGDRDFTALSEINHKNGYAAVSRFSMTRGVRLIPIGEMTAIQRSGRGTFLQEHSDVVTNMLNACDYSDALTLITIDAFLADMIAAPDCNYAETNAIAEAMFSKDPNAKGLAYPSVKCRGGMNFAVKVDHFWEDWDLNMVTFADYRSAGHSVYRPLSRRNATDITDCGDIRWGEAEDNVRIGNLLSPFTPRVSYPLR